MALVATRDFAECISQPFFVSKFQFRIISSDTNIQRIKFLSCSLS